MELARSEALSLACTSGGAELRSPSTVSSRVPLRVAGAVLGLVLALVGVPSAAAGGVWKKERVVGGYVGGPDGQPLAVNDRGDVVLPVGIGGSRMGVAVRRAGGPLERPRRVPGAEDAVRSDRGAVAALSPTGEGIVAWEWFDRSEAGCCMVLRGSLLKAGRIGRAQTVSLRGELAFGVIAAGGPDGRMGLVWYSRRSVWGAFASARSGFEAPQEISGFQGGFPIGLGFDRAGVATWLWTPGLSASSVRSARRSPSGAVSRPRTVLRRGRGMSDFRSFADTVAQVDAAGAQVMVWTREASFNQTIEAAFASGGGPFGRVQTLGRGFDPVLAVAPDGFAIAGWTEERATGPVVRAALRRPGGRFGRSMVVSAPGETRGLDPRVAIASGGHAAVMWTGSRFVIRAALRRPGGRFTAPATLGKGDAHSGNVGIDARGRAIAAWRGEPRGLAVFTAR